jgi:hypothetical protein
VFVWERGDIAEAPTVLGAHVEEVRSGHSEEPLEPHAPAEGGAAAWDERIEELGRRYETAVLSWTAPDGFPLSMRLPVSLDAQGRRILCDAEPTGMPLAAGRACLTAHRHGPRFEWQENFQVRGDLVRADGGWALVPHRLVGGFELPDESMLARYRRNFTKTVRFWHTARKYRRG